MNNPPGYDQAYQSANIIQKKIVFNRKSSDDLALLEWIDLQENFNRYCKDLIRADMREKRSQLSSAP